MTGQTADGWQWCRRPGAVMHYPNRPALNTDLSLMTSELFSSATQEAEFGEYAATATAKHFSCDD